ncbi:MAG: ABC transporter substrate-binding protein [Phycisphaerales bacterium]|nr:ABC transporter substrate-binding protein [Phycisphaerales bacterium]
MPSATRTLTLLGAHDDLVACSHLCRADGHLPRLTAQPTGPESHLLIHEWLVRDIRPPRQSLYTLDTDQLAALEPDLVIFSDDLIDPDAMRHAMDQAPSRTPGLPVVLRLRARTIEDTFDNVLRIGQACGRTPEAENLAVLLQARMYASQEYVASFEPRRPVVAFLEWCSPLVLAGHWRVQMIERAGGEHPWNPTVPSHGAGAAAGPQQAQRRAGPPISTSTPSISDAHPDSVILALPGVTLERAGELVQPLLAEPWFLDLPAARTGRVALVDGREFHEPGPGLVDAFRWLVGWIQDRPHLLDAIPWTPLC